MTYLSLAQLEARSAELWRAHKLDVGFDAETLVDSLDLRLLWDDIDDAGGDHIFGAFRPPRRQVILNTRHRDTLEQNRGLRRFTIAHEIGHWILHVRPTAGGQLAFMHGDHVWCRERSQDPAEVQAERFGSYLLMPTDRLRPALPPRPWSGWSTVYELAKRFDTSATAMIVRLEGGGWAYRDASGTPRSGKPPLDDSRQLFLSIG